MRRQRRVNSLAVLAVPVAILATFTFAASGAPGPHASRSAARRPAPAPGLRVGGPLRGAHLVKMKTGGQILNISGNWSGYAAVGHATSVAATWVQNAVKCTSASPSASEWVGIDGYNSDTVEQTGSDGACNGRGKPDYYVWYEMYPKYPVTFKVPVKPGDHFSGSVTWSHGHTYTLTLSDLTQHWTKTETESAKGARNSSAEAVLEEDGSELSGFGTEAFQGVTVDGKPIGDFTGHGYTLSRMEIANAGDVPDVTAWVCDTTSPLSGKQDFSVTRRTACPNQGVVAGYPADRERAFDFSCGHSTGTVTGHPVWVSNLCPKDMTVSTGKSFKQCHTLTANDPSLQLAGQPARYSYPAKCPA